MSYFLVPVIGVGNTRQDARRPKYISALAVKWIMVDHDDAAIVWAQTSAAQDTSIDANADATLIPALDTLVNVAATQTAMEALLIPAQWVTGAMTYRQVLRIAVGMAQLIQRTDGLLNKLKLAGRLDMTMAQIPVEIRQSLADASDSLELDRSAIVASTTVRAALRDLGTQFAQGRVSLLADL